MRTKLLTGVGVLLLGLCGCGGDSASAPSPAPPSFPYAGTWKSPATATTGGAQRIIAFTVSNDQLTTMTIPEIMIVILPQNIPASCETQLTLVAPAAIANNSFIAQVRSPYGSTTVRGTFTSPNAANGTWDAWEATSPACNGNVSTKSRAAGTWQAAKE